MGRLVMVSNRVGSSLKSNQGGLATALLASLGKRDVLWLGWSGDITDGAPAATQVQSEGRLTRMLVDLERSDYEGYYSGFANRVLWPLFHYRVGLAEYSPERWSAYCRVNDLFAERLAAELMPDEDVWIHDYHLIPLAAALRRLGVKNRLGFFLHTPFPGPEVLTTLPVHEALVRALFAHDLVGFQTDKDALALGDYVTRDADGWLGEDGIAHAFGTQVRVGTFPISIDTKVVAGLAARAARTNQAARLRNSLSNRQLVIGVDRLDYSKGLTRRFLAVERLLDTRPHHRRAVVVLQIAPLTREDVPEYQQIRADLDACMGRINGRFGEPDILPVRYLNRHFRQETLFGFYRASQVGLVTPLRDGMNLVAKEYVASQDPENPGVLVLSRFAGAAQELATALVVNPFDIDQVTDALDRALTMPLEERRERHRAMMARLEEHDVHAWSASFLAALRESRANGGGVEHEHLPEGAVWRVATGGSVTARRATWSRSMPPPLRRGQALFLDFDGTLVDIAAAPGLVEVPPKTGCLLRTVAVLLDGAVAIVSGRKVDDLLRLLGPFPGVLVGQHGLERRYLDGRTIRKAAPHAIADIRPALAEFAARHDGVEIEDKGGSLALHYRLAPALADECSTAVKTAARASGGAFAAISGKMVAELIPQDIGKGEAIAALLAEPPFAGRIPVFVGDDRADEDGFAMVQRGGGIAIHVGDGASVARYRLSSVAAVRAWLGGGVVP